MEDQGYSNMVSHMVEEATYLMQALISFVEWLNMCFILTCKIETKKKKILLDYDSWFSWILALELV